MILPTTKPNVFVVMVHAVFVTTFLAVGDGTQAVSVFSQEELARFPGSLASNNTATVPQGIRVADNFQIPSGTPTIVRSIRFVGGYVPATLDDDVTISSDSFRIEFFENVAEAPGDILTGGAFLNAEALQRIELNGVVLSTFIEAYQYVVELDAPLTLMPDTTYWVSISNDQSPNFGWVWGRAAEGFDDGMRSTDPGDPNGPWNLIGSGNLFFSLHNQIAPEPSTALLTSGAVLSISSLFRDRRTKRCVPLALPVS